MAIKVKRSVTLDEDVVVLIESLGTHASLSEAANEGLRLVAVQARLQALVDEHEHEHRTVPPHLVEEVAAWLQG